MTTAHDAPEIIINRRRRPPWYVDVVDVVVPVVIITDDKLGADPIRRARGTAACDADDDNEPRIRVHASQSRVHARALRSFFPRVCENVVSKCILFTLVSPVSGPSR